MSILTFNGNISDGGLRTTLAQWSVLLRGLSIKDNFMNSNTWQDWEPTYSASGSMTFVPTSTIARFLKINELVFFRLQSIGTTGGVANAEIRFSPPVVPLPDDTINTSFSASVLDGAGEIAGVSFIKSTTDPLVAVKRYDAMFWSLGADRQIDCSGFYEVAA